MRTLVDIPDEKLAELAAISARRKLSRAAVVREAISAYIEAHRRDDKDDGFALWGYRKIDGLAYQRKMRAEW
jgi:metal-responsive CopG/Arc/MetJ family transcriptional regulator